VLNLYLGAFSDHGIQTQPTDVTQVPENVTANHLPNQDFLEQGTNPSHPFGMDGSHLHPGHNYYPSLFPESFNMQAPIQQIVAMATSFDDVAISQNVELDNSAIASVMSMNDMSQSAMFGMLSELDAFLPNYLQSQNPHEHT
jgi:hypothetical protein